MPLPTPILDDRSYEQLRDELVQRIPVYAPEWTDHNASDPGIALLELFAFLGENLLFRFNQIPESTKLQFLRLLDVPLRPAAVAGGLVAFATKVPAGVRVDLRTTVYAGKLPFETTGEAHAWPVSARGVGRLTRSDPRPGEEQHFAQRALDARRRLYGNEQPLYCETVTLNPDPARPDATPLDLTRSVDRQLWIAVLGERGAALDQMLSGHLDLGVVPDEDVPSMAAAPVCPGEVDPATPPSVVWQCSTTELDTTGEPRYLALGLDGDTTKGLTRPGVVRLKLPRESRDLGLPPPPPDPDVAGTGEWPPELDDDLAKSLLFWIRCYREDESHFARLLWVGANAAEVEQVESANPEFLGVGTGDAYQRAQLVNRPVIPGTVVLQVEGPTDWLDWKEVPDFAASGENDPHYVLDPEAGEIRFGDGVRGYAPQIGRRIRVKTYRFGGGKAGNVAPKAISRLDLAQVTVSNPLPMRGGADGESVVAALERVPGELRRHDRAVTRGDFSELALATPGAALGRAECLPLFHPKRPNDTAAGVVSVVVWPREDAKHPNAPVPDATTLRTVCSWLDKRRLVTTELYVIPPTYHKIAVAVGIHTKAGYGVEAVRSWVELVLRQYLAPLPPYGPGGSGWPLGHRVYGPELEAAALQVEGVEYLEGLKVAGSVDGGVTFTEPSPILLARYEVPELAEITVVEGPPLDPGVALTPPALPGTPPPTPVPIPVPVEEC